MPSYKILDKNGATVHRSLTMDAATSMVEILLTADSSRGGMKIVPDVPGAVIQQAQSVQRGMPLQAQEVMSWTARTIAEAAQAVEPGAERENLQLRIEHRTSLKEVVTAAEEAAAKVAQRVAHYDAESTRLQSLCEAEIAEAGTTLAISIKNGGSAPMRLNLGDLKAQLLDATTEKAMAEVAQHQLDEELQAARDGLATAEKEVEVAAGLVVKAHLQHVAQELDECWKRANELRNLLDSGHYAGFPLDIKTTYLMRPPEPQPVRFGPQIARWKRALMQDAGAQFDDQAAA